VKAGATTLPGLPTQARDPFQLLRMLLVKLSDKWAEATRSFVLAAWRGEMLFRSTPGVSL
jgi:hypothetical protein